MKHAIYPEKQGVVTGTSEDANYPWTNLTDNDIRMKVGKAVAGVAEVTLRAAISANASVIAVVNTNAETAICTITLDSAEKTFNAAGASDEGGGIVAIMCNGHGLSEDDVVLINGTTNYDGVYTLPAQGAYGANEFIITATYAAEAFSGTETVCVVVKSTTHTLDTGTREYDNFWEEYTEQVAAHTATIKLTIASGTVEAGILRAGGLYTIHNPSAGVKEGRKGFHVEKYYRSGADYSVKGSIVKTFNYSMNLARATEFQDLMALYDYYGPNPFMMLLSDELIDKQFTVFGKFFSPPGGSHDFPVDSPTEVSIIQVV